MHIFWIDKVMKIFLLLLLLLNLPNTFENGTYLLQECDKSRDQRQRCVLFDKKDFLQWFPAV